MGGIDGGQCSVNKGRQLSPAIALRENEFAWATVDTSPDARIQTMAERADND